jgi:hypothetical protein
MYEIFLMSDHFAWIAIVINYFWKYHSAMYPPREEAVLEPRRPPT